MSKETYIELKNVSKNYGDIKAVDNLSLNIYKDDIYGFLGPNGAGKSTSIRMILSLIKPTTGKINIFGHNLSEKRNETLGRIGSLIEKPDFYNYLSARKNLELLGKISGLKGKNLNIKIDEVLELVGLLKRQNSKVKTFSQGMKQRLGIAQTLIHEPDLIILDEPANGLDPQGQIEMRELIKTINRDKGITVVISSHILVEIEQIANRMVIINKGKNIVEGDVKELLSGSGMRVSINTNDNKNALDFLQSIYNSKAECKNERISLNIDRDKIPEINRQLIDKGFDMYSIEPVRSLEEFFINITKND